MNLKHYFFKLFWDSGQLFHATKCYKWEIPYFLRGNCFQKLLPVWNFSCINKNGYFIKETDTFGYILVYIIKTSHIYHFKSQHTAFEQSAVCLSVVLCNFGRWLKGGHFFWNIFEFEPAVLVDMPFKISSVLALVTNSFNRVEAFGQFWYGGLYEKNMCGSIWIWATSGSWGVVV